MYSQGPGVPGCTVVKVGVLDGKEPRDAAAPGLEIWTSRRVSWVEGWESKGSVQMKEGLSR